MSDTVEGWLTAAQAAVLAEAGRRVGAPGLIVEIGSFRGRSTIELARAAPAGVDVVAIDPHLGSDRGPQEIAARPALGEEDHDAFHANLAAAGVEERVRHVRLRSQEALGAVPGEIDLLYVDGAHRLAPARADLRDWGARVRPGGTLLVHDAFSSIGVTLALLSTLLGRRGWTYRGRTGSLARYERVPGRSALRQLAQLPWFARNVALKILIAARVPGFRGRPWPY